MQDGLWGVRIDPAGLDSCVPQRNEQTSLKCADECFLLPKGSSCLFVLPSKAPRERNSTVVFVLVMCSKLFKIYKQESSV